MTRFPSFAALRAACLDLPPADAAAAASAVARDATLTKPPGSLGRLEDLAVWLAQWQGRHPPRLDRIEVLVFAGNHGIVAQRFSYASYFPFRSWKPILFSCLSNFIGTTSNQSEHEW